MIDRLPRGFRFEPGSVRVANARATQVQMQGDRELHITLDRVAAADTAQAAGQGASSSDVTITYRLRAGVGSSQGDGINRAHVQCLGRDGASRSQCSNESRWKVRVTGGIFSDEACLAGQIYVDCNGNSVKDREELGFFTPGRFLYSVDGEATPGRPLLTLSTQASFTTGDPASEASPLRSTSSYTLRAGDVVMLLRQGLPW